ncbi:hypothetical protein VE02_09313 [Pseudogymnoascus sp. 03VT05]|nr:hypothetical protein VE02_09313 [Pseudogymnoascus sp. 03VT05]
MKRRRNSSSSDRSTPPSPRKQRRLRETTPSRLNAAGQQQTAAILNQTADQTDQIAPPVVPEASAVHAKKPATMRPSKDESESWYFGIDTRMERVSLLIARSSTYAFQPFTDETKDEPENSPRKERKQKCMFTVGGHKITTIYDSILRLKVQEILSGLKWQSIDVVRLGYYDDEPNNPPVILVTVAINDVDEVRAQEAVEKIHDLMVRFELPDVHAEIKTGRLFDQVEYHQNRLYPLEPLRVPKMGASIGNANLDSAGSLCLYLKIDGINYGLTCQHVATSSKAPFTSPNDPVIILQPARKDLRKYEISQDDGIKEETPTCQEYQAEKEMAEEMNIPLSTGRTKAGQQSENKLKRCIANKLKMEDVRLPFGVLTHAPGISTHHLTNHIRDWALVKLDDERFQTLPPNILPPPHFVDEDKRMIMKVYGRKAGEKELQFSKPVTEIVPLKELQHILKVSGPEDHQEKESLRVVKHGRTSGWTAGSLNEIRSDCCFQDRTTEYCVVNLPGMNRFSYKGDSGSCVLDLDGKIMGMLHSGNGENQPFGAEITYVTPMEWLLKDIKETLNTENVVIEKSEKGVGEKEVVIETGENVEKGEKGEKGVGV